MESLQRRPARQGRGWRARRRRIAQLEAQLTTLRRAQVADVDWLPGLVDEILARAAVYTEADRSRAAWAEHVQLERRIRQLLAQGTPEAIVDVAAALADALPTLSRLQVELLENYCAAEKGTP
jgi:hypothetical protein